MYRLDFIAEHGMRSYKAHRVAPRSERVAACLIKCTYFQEAEGHKMGLPFSWLLLLGKQKNQLALLPINNYKVVKVVMCGNPTFLNLSTDKSLVRIIKSLQLLYEHKIYAIKPPEFNAWKLRGTTLSRNSD